MEIKIDYLKGVVTTWEYVEKVKVPCFNSDCDLKYDMLKYLESEGANVEFDVDGQTCRRGPKCIPIQVYDWPYY